eukprot:458544-Prymnesium_polylepis.1
MTRKLAGCRSFLSVSTPATSATQPARSHQPLLRRCRKSHVSTTCPFFCSSSWSRWLTARYSICA